MFMGTYYNSIDAKNRLIVPSKFRDQLGGKCVLTMGADACLYIYSVDGFREQMEKMLAGLSESEKDVRDIIRHFTATGVECEFDRQGRIVIPQILMDHAGIKKDLVTMGVMNKIEVWSKEVWETPEYEGKMKSEKFADVLEKYQF